jgi:putative hydrolase
MKELLIESLKKDKSIEINTKYIFEKDRYFKLFKEINPYVSIGSDAHSREEIARSFDMIREVVKK